MVLTAGARTVAVTGAAGFVGRALCAKLRDAGWTVRPLVREARGAVDGETAIGAIESASPETLARAVAGATAVVHLAGRAHVTKETARDPEAAYRAANVEATERLARAAVAEGVARFVYASSVKAAAESSPAGRPLHPGDEPAPQDAYGVSKLAAERALAVACSGTRTAPIVLRLPLVVGPGARGNVARLADAIAAGRTLPFGAIDNRRSVIGLANLCEAIVAALDAPKPPAGVHYVGDAEPVSTPAFVRALAAALGRPAPLAIVPVPLLRLAGALIGRRGATDRVTGTLEVDAASFREATGWTPRHTLADECAAIAAAMAGR